jgi:hypothetical protein
VFAARHPLHHLAVQPLPAADMRNDLLHAPLPEEDRGHRCFVHAIYCGEQLAEGEARVGDRGLFTHAVVP